MKNFLEVMEEGSRLDAAVSDRRKSIGEFEEKYTRFMSLITNESGMPSHRRVYLMREAESTSDFPTLFGTVLERTLLAKYKIIAPDWKQYIKVGSQNDFRSANLMATYGLQSAMDEVKQLGEYPSAALADGKFVIALKKYGRKFPLAWEALVNDDLGAFNDLAQSLANAARATEWIQAVKSFVQSSGPNTTLFSTGGTHPIDGGSFVNKGTLALSADNIGTVVAAMQDQKDTDGNAISITRFHLVVPPAKRIPALKALSDSALIATGLSSTSAAAVQTSENVIAKLPITLHVNEYLTSVDTSGTKNFTWYMFADPQQDGAAAQLNYLRGRENPEIVQKASDKVSVGGGAVPATEGDFDNDAVQWRVRHILGTTQLDPRFAYAEQASS